MLPFSLELPRAIHFGVDSLDLLRSIVSDLGRSALVVCGTRWLQRSEWKNRVEGALEGLETRWVSCDSGEPSTGSLARTVQATGGAVPDVIVGIGGGSVIDTAKALSALLRYGGPAERFLEGVELSMPIPGPAIPWIGVPTTAGTGAEVTKNAVVRSEASGVKRSMRSTHLLASAVIVDPRLTASLPLRETGTSGLDALTQLVEACVSRKSNPLVRSLVRGAFAPMFDALEGLPRDPGNLGLRSAASYGALVSGIALANAGLGAAHGFAAAVGGLYGVPHGLACAIFLPPVLEANAAEIRGILAELVEVKAPGTADPVGWLADKVRSMVDAFSLPADLKGFAIPREGIPDLAQKASGASMKGNPRELSQEERMRIISRVV